MDVRIAEITERGPEFSLEAFIVRFSFIILLVHFMLNIGVPSVNGS